MRVTNLAPCLCPSPPSHPASAPLPPHTLPHRKEGQHGRNRQAPATEHLVDAWQCLVHRSRQRHHCCRPPQLPQLLEVECVHHEVQHLDGAARGAWINTTHVRCERRHICIRYWQKDYAASPYYLPTSQKQKQMKMRLLLPPLSPTFHTPTHPLPQTTPQQ